MDELTSAIDAVWRSPAAPLDAAAEALQASKSAHVCTMLFAETLLSKAGEWLEVDVAEPDSHTIVLSHKNLSLSATGSVVAGLDDEAIVQFIDQNISLVVDSRAFREAWGSSWKYNASSVLAGLQFARDHADSMLFLPAELRTSRFSQLSGKLGLEEDVLSGMIAKSGRLQRTYTN